VSGSGEASSESAVADAAAATDPPPRLWRYGAARSPCSIVRWLGLPISGNALPRTRLRALGAAAWPRGREPFAASVRGTPSGCVLVPRLRFRAVLVSLILITLEACATRGVVSDDLSGTPPEQISAETKNSDWSSYRREAIRRIREHWEIPALAASGFKGRVTIRFVVRRSGQVEAPEVVSPSSLVAFDRAAVKAVLRAGPLSPFPVSIPGERKQMTVTFFYNMKP
jgi:TonB family protein